MTDFTHEIPKIEQPESHPNIDAYFSSVDRHRAVGTDMHAVGIMLFDRPGGLILKHSWTDVNAGTDRTRGNIAGILRILEIIRVSCVDIDNVHIFSNQEYMYKYLKKTIDNGIKDNEGAFNLHQMLLDEINALGGFDKLHLKAAVSKQRLEAAKDLAQWDRDHHER